MSKQKEIFRRLENGQSIRSISKDLQVHRNTISGYQKLLKDLGYSYKEALALEEVELARIISLEKQRVNHNRDERYAYLQKQFEYYDQEIKRRGVTVLLLWEEYCKGVNNPYSYTQFSLLYRQYKQRFKATMHFEHNPGEYLQIDFAGDKINYLDKETGELIACEVLIGTLPFSSYCVAIALPNQQQETFVKGIAYILRRIGKVPKNIKIDNLKSGVIKSDRYEPTFNQLLEQLSTHYNTNLTAARVRKPRDKASVERSVQEVYKNAHGRLRNKTFYSIKELNEAIVQEMNTFCDKPIKTKGNSTRKDLLQIEQQSMEVLPTKEFITIKERIAKVGNSYHIMLSEDKHQYSVPYNYIGQEVILQYSADTVQVYDKKYNKIAHHARNKSAYKYSTIDAHMPNNHSAYKDQLSNTAQYYINEGAKIGPFTKQYICKLLKSKKYEQQTYDSCKGLLRLSKQYTNNRLEKACELLQEADIKSYHQAKNILDKKIDLGDGYQPSPSAYSANTKIPFDTLNTRGSQYYK